MKASDLCLLLVLLLVDWRWDQFVTCNLFTGVESLKELAEWEQENVELIEEYLQQEQEKLQLLRVYVCHRRVVYVHSCVNAQYTMYVR